MTQEKTFKFDYKDGKIGEQPSVSCKHYEDCWKNLSDSQKKDNGPSLYVPYIGSEYNKTRILFIGMNFNGCEENEAGAACFLANIAHRQIINEGKIKTFANKKDGKKYSGSFLWHRILLYTALYLRFKNQCLYDSGLSKLPSKDELDVAFNHLAFTNIVKCCPNTKNCNPTEEMYKNCSEHYLKHEISILKPEVLVLFGQKTLRHFCKQFPLHSSELNKENKFVKTFSYSDNDLNFRVLKFFHPGSGKGIAKVNYSELVSVLKNT